MTSCLFQTKSNALLLYPQHARGPALICAAARWVDGVCWENDIKEWNSWVTEQLLCSGSDATGLVLASCHGMRLVRSDSRAVGACLSRTELSPAGPGPALRLPLSAPSCRAQLRRLKDAVAFFYCPNVHFLLRSDRSVVTNWCLHSQVRGLPGVKTMVKVHMWCLQ